MMMIERPAIDARVLASWRDERLLECLPKATGG